MVFSAEAPKDYMDKEMNLYLQPPFNGFSGIGDDPSKVGKLACKFADHYLDVLRREADIPRGYPAPEFTGSSEIAFNIMRYILNRDESEFRRYSHLSHSDMTIVIEILSYLYEAHFWPYYLMVEAKSGFRTSGDVIFNATTLVPTYDSYVEKINIHRRNLTPSYLLGLAEITGNMLYDSPPVITGKGRVNGFYKELVRQEIIKEK